MRLAGLACVLLLAGCSGELTVEDPWVRAAPPKAAMTAGYLTLNNPGREERILVGASSDSHAQVSVHETVVEDGTSKMRHLDQLPVPGNSRVAFTPGGRHLMLMQPTRELTDGDTVAITLRFADGGAVTVDANVRRNR